MANPSSENAPLITIGMPTYRRAGYLRFALESCLAQTADNFEIIVHDDTEDDTIRKIVESFKSPKIRYLQNRPARGLVNKLNDFSEMARGEWVVFLCDDDRFAPDYIATLTRQISAHPDAALIRVRYRMIDSEGREMRLDSPSPEVSSPFLFISQLFRPDHENFRINLSGVAFRKSLFKQIGGVKNLGPIWHIDRLCWAELGAQGEVICDPQALCEIRMHGGSITSTVDPQYDGAINAGMLTKGHVDVLLDDLDKRAASAEDKALVAKARDVFDVYHKRHLARALDQGLLAAFDDPTKSVHAELKVVEEKMRRLGVPPFRSLYFYRIGAWLPGGLRDFAVARLKEAKLARRKST